MIKDGMEHIHKVMHVFIEGLAAGVYTSVDDIQQDAKEYLAMEKAVEKLSNWNKSSKIEDLASIFEGLSNSLNRKKEDLEWDMINDMPTIGEEDAE